MSVYEKFRENPFFNEFSDDELRILADFTEEQSFGEGEVIFDEKSPTTAVYFILHGRISIYRSLMGHTNFLTILERNDIFGEVSFADHQARSASALAISMYMASLRRQSRPSSLAKAAISPMQRPEQ